jgi:thiol-disulfide isomerase/thioredoxin
MRLAPFLLLAACGRAVAAPPASTPKPLSPPDLGAPLPAFTVERWLNSPPLTPEQLRGKVVLVDFWEYTCVNCIRTLPFVKAWHRTYAPAGLVVVGVHAPEFDFGKRAENIERGIRDHGLTYPIALDNEFATWTAYHNNAWPAKYLFGPDGKLAGMWLGEGHYDEVEERIRTLLGAARARDLPPATAEVAAWKRSREERVELSPETYLGSERRVEGSVARVGAWQSAPEYVEHVGDEPGKLVLDVVAGEVNLVMAPGKSGKAEVIVKLDGQRLAAAQRGADVGEDGVARFDRSGMIRLVKGAATGKHRLELETKDEGLRAFAFTFGP